MRPTTRLPITPSASPARASTRLRRRLAALAMLGGLAVLATACGDDDTTATTTTTATATDDTAGDAADPDTIVVTGADYRFDGLPEQVVAGTRFELTNGSATELHEMVAVRLPDDEQRPLDELVASGLESMFTAPPAFVLLAAPAGEQIAAVGDGVLGEPGRYVFVCMIPTGIDPQAYLTAAAAGGDGPPQVDGGGAPHVMNGMYGEVTVVAAD